jgi:hypothetical protein
MTTYDVFLCWIIVVLLVLVVGEASMIKVGVNQTYAACNRLIRSPHCRRPLEHEGPHENGTGTDSPTLPFDYRLRS